MYETCRQDAYFRKTTCNKELFAVLFYHMYVIQVLL